MIQPNTEKYFPTYFPLYYQASENNSLFWNSLSRNLLFKKKLLSSKQAGLSEKEDLLYPKPITLFILIVLGQNYLGAVKKIN